MKKTLTIPISGMAKKKKDKDRACFDDLEYMALETQLMAINTMAEAAAMGREGEDPFYAADRKKELAFQAVQAARCLKDDGIENKKPFLEVLKALLDHLEERP
jgi:hypothetical protein